MCKGNQASELFYLLNSAIQYHHSGKLKNAEKKYNIILNTFPNHPDALHLLGVISHQQGKYDVAENLISKAIAFDATQPSYFNNLGNVYTDMAEWTKAVICFEKALSLRPNFAEAHLGLANVLQVQNDLHKSATCYKKALHLNPDLYQAYYNLGLLYLKQDEKDKALECFKKTIRKKPDYAEAHYGLGNTYKSDGNIKKALSSYQKALSLNLPGIDALLDIGRFFEKNGALDVAIRCYQKAAKAESKNALTIFMKLGILNGKLERYAEAIFNFKKAIEIAPESEIAHYHIGIVYDRQNIIDKALSSYQRALELKPDYIEACVNMGALHHKCENFDKAFHYYQKVIRIEPHNALLYNNLGLFFLKHQRIDEAIKCFEKALRIDPNYTDAFCHLFLQLQHACDWNRLSSMSGELDKRTETELKKPEKASETPFQNITRHDNPALNLAVAKSWSEELSRPISKAGIKFAFDASRRKNKKITIGYLSNNYGNHPVSHLMQYLFGLHDRNNFNIFCYSYGKDDGSHYRKTIAQDCDKFVDLFDLSYLDSAKCIHEDQVDILVDLVGHTENNRMGISAYRPAPVQVSYLGFLGSTGADFIDYIITDKIVTPEEHARYYTENFVYMPHTYQVNNNVISDSKIQIKKSDFNLPENSFVFCSFNKPYKIEPQIFDTWMRILKKTDNSILWLYSGGEIAERNLRGEAKAKGVDPDRLIFASMMPLENHLARLKLADLALDTRIYNGGATTSNALWAGIPVITILGAHFVSRMTASSLDAVGLPELITHSLEEYETLAIHLAKNPEELRKIKRRLEKNLLTTPLFDTQGFVRDLETAYRQIWEIYLSNKTPRQIVVQNHSNFENNVLPQRNATNAHTMGRQISDDRVNDHPK